MCDYCGCRRQAAIEELSLEHEQLLDLIYRLHRDVERDDHPAVVRRIESELAPLLRQHTDKEERGLFVQLRAAWIADDRLRVLEGEHRRVEELLDRVVRGGKGWQDALERLGDELSEHTFDEETDLFPYAVYELSDEQWAAVEEAHGLAAQDAVAAAGDGPWTMT